MDTIGRALRRVDHTHEPGIFDNSELDWETKICLRVSIRPDAQVGRRRTPFAPVLSEGQHGVGDMRLKLTPAMDS